MKFAFSANAFRNHTLSETIRMIGLAEYAGIEIMADRPHAYPPDLDRAAIDRIKAETTAASLTIANINAFMLCAIQDFHHPSWIEADRAFRQQRITYTIQCLELAAHLGVPTISTEPGGPLDGMDRQQALDIFADGLNRVLPRARDLGVTLLIEPEPGLLLETSEQYLDFITAHGQEGLALNFDIGHFFCVGEDPAQKIHELRHHIRHFHLEDIPADRSHRHILPGDGAIDLASVLQAITDIGYDGFVTVELYPYEDSAAETARKARQFLNTLGHG